MTAIIAIVNQKGGVGKTTTAVNMATALSAIKKTVCLIDLDPQGNASTGLGIPRENRRVTSYDLLLGNAQLQNASQKTHVPRLSVVPSTIDLSGAEVELIEESRREYRLKHAITRSAENWDYLIIDCPPSLGIITLNALTAATTVMIPLQCEFYALEGLSHLMRTIQLVRKKLNPALDINGVVLTMHDRRNKLTENVETDVREFLGDTVYNTVIPRNVRVSEAPSHGKPVLLYDIDCSGSQAYIELAKELLRREKEALAEAA